MPPHSVEAPGRQFTGSTDQINAIKIQFGLEQEKYSESIAPIPLRMPLITLRVDYIKELAKNWPGRIRNQRRRLKYISIYLSTRLLLSFSRWGWMDVA